MYFIAFLIPVIRNKNMINKDWNNNIYHYWKSKIRDKINLFKTLFNVNQ